MKRAIFLAMAALLAMLILVPMAMAQDTTMMMEATMIGPAVRLAVFRRAVVLPSFCRRPRCFSGRAF